MQKSRDGDRCEVRVQFKATDDAEQIATGIVMVPDKVDLQGDYVRPDTISQFAEQFGNFEAVGEGGGGVMHAVWPDEHISLESNEVLASETDIGDGTAPAGAWVQAWHFADAELWGLVSDGILEGYSIGAIDVEWSGPMNQEDLDDGVTVADDYPDGELVWELRDGIIREVSAVDIPAVPDALILETKSDDEAAKRLSDYLGNRDGFVDEAIERGHTEAEAERLWEYLNAAVDMEGAGDPGSKSAFARAGRAFLNAFTGGREDAKSSDPSSKNDSEAKESRTLSASNKRRLMAAHDALEDALSSDVAFETNQFTDNAEFDFEIGAYGASVEAAAEAPNGDEPAESGREAVADEDDTDTTETDMSEDTDDPLADAPEWAKAMHDDIEENSKAITSLSEKFEKGGADDEKSDDEPADPEKAWDDAPGWAKDLRESQDDLADDVTDLREASGKSLQLAGDGDDEDEKESSLDGLAAVMG